MSGSGARSAALAIDPRCTAAAPAACDVRRLPVWAARGPPVHWADVMRPDVTSPNPPVAAAASSRSRATRARTRRYVVPAARRRRPTAVHFLHAAHVSQSSPARIRSPPQPAAALPALRRRLVPCTLPTSCGLRAPVSLSSPRGHSTPCHSEHSSRRDLATTRTNSQSLAGAA